MTSTTSSQSDFIKLLIEHQPSLRAFITSLMPGSSDIDDVLQNTNVVLWEKMKTFRVGSNFQAWAFAIARNQVKAQWRANKRDRSPLFAQSIIDCISTHWIEQETGSTPHKEKALEHCLAKLKSSEREIIDARYANSKSLEEQASSIGRPAESIRVSLFRIRERLRSCVEKRLNLMEGGAI